MTIQAGILGFAHGHVIAYCNGWRDNPDWGVKVVAAWDHDADRLKQQAEAYGLTPFDSPEALLKDGGVDAVVVSAETAHHADLVEQAAAAGKAIIVQKPLALTLPQADRIVAAVEQHGVPFTMAWQMRTDPQNIKMRELVQGGELGQVVMVRRRHGLSTHLWPDFKNTWHNQPELNRDIWADDSSHPIDFIHWMLGVPESVTAELETLLNPEVRNDNGIAIFKYPGGPIAEVVCSFVTPALENTTEVVAEKGSIVQNYGDGPSTMLPQPEGSCGLRWHIVGNTDWVRSDIPSPPGHGHRIAGLAQPLAEWLNGKRPPIATAEEARTSLRMVLACYVSSREGRRVRLDDPAIDQV